MVFIFGVFSSVIGAVFTGSSLAFFALANGFKWGFSKDIEIAMGLMDPLFKGGRQ